ncbi:hypothetical protein GCM10022393_03980 [Aquimarina addita]|uniref:Secretion system C-terminal sorting domain-containing protein n=2 Tax=Aquimarina addita TaxID=870485 RepID=A0ABP7X9C8_9FLAO
MEIGMNLSPINYYASQHIFKDYALGKDQWRTNLVGGNLANTNQKDRLSFDTNGYPLSLPQSVDGQNIIVISYLTANGYMPVDDYILLYEGEGDIDFGGSLSFTEEISEGYIRFKVTSDGNGFIRLNSSTVGNHIKNIKAIPEKYINNFENEPFHPEFLNKIAPLSTLRMMDLLKTNNWDTSFAEYTDDLDAFMRKREWNERILPTYYTQATDKGMSYEHIIAIANEAKKDLWLTIPHNASNGYVRQMARLFRDNLDPEVKLYIEYSNELWNWAFQQTRYVDQLRFNGDFPSAINHWQAAAMRTQQIFNIWMQEFDTSSDRLVRVLAAQSANSYVASQWISILDESEWDVLAITHYFNISNAWTPSGQTPDPTNQFRDRLMAMGSAATVNDIIDLARENREYLLENWGEDSGIKGNIKLAADLGKPTVTYEGGTHMIHSNDIDNPVLLQTMYEASTSQQSADLYNEVIQDFRDWGVTLMMGFNLFGEPNIWGHWGHYDHTFQTEIPPKMQVILDNISPCQTNTSNPGGGEEEEGRLVHITMKNTPDFAIDGNWGGIEGRNVHLWKANQNNVNQLWYEIDRGDGYYSYQKYDTNVCLQANEGVSNYQNLHLGTKDNESFDQQWNKISIDNGIYRLNKRGTTLGISGVRTPENGDLIELMYSNNDNPNLHWIITPVTDVNKNGIINKSSDIAIYPNTVKSITTVVNAAGSVVRFYDLSGKVIMTMDIAIDQEVIDLSDFSSGLYYAEIKKNEEGIREVLKIIKQ